MIKSVHEGGSRDTRRGAFYCGISDGPTGPLSLDRRHYPPPNLVFVLHNDRRSTRWEQEEIGALSCKCKTCLFLFEPVSFIAFAVSSSY